jgi:TPP-dependent pyruvate/acetoin dehydrogenase alpha subunit
LSCKYYRYLEHVGINEDFEAGYRSKDEFMEWLKRDPLNIQRKKLIGLGYEKTVIQIEQEIDEKISKSIAAAKSAGFLPVETLSNGVFA